MFSLRGRTVSSLRSLRCSCPSVVRTPNLSLLLFPTHRCSCSSWPSDKQNGGAVPFRSDLWRQNGNGWRRFPSQHLSAKQRPELSSETASNSSVPPPCSYVTAKIHCRRRIADVFSETLLCFGASSASIDAQDDLGEDDEIYVCSIFASDKDVDRCIALAANSIGLEKIPSYETSVNEQYDWTKQTQEMIHPYEVTSGLWIIPEGRDPPDVLAENIILNPGMVFGTGEHPTTKMCLLMLHRLIRGGERFLDYGTGTGILGIAALKMGASQSVGTDISPVAILSASKNLCLNGISPDKMQLYLADREVTFASQDKRILLDEKLVSSDCSLRFRKGEFDIIIANILLNSLIELAEDIVSYGKPGAMVGVSGILSEQVHQIKEIYSLYLENVTVSQMDGWACLSGSVKTSRC